MIDSVGFNSSTLYRYATVNLDALEEQLGNAKATAKAAAVFVESFIRSMPTGKQNSYANRTLPETCIVAFRENQPINAVSAFEQPVRSEHGSPVSAVASRKLVDELVKIQDVYGEKPASAWVVSTDLSKDEMEAIAQPVNLQELTGNVEDEVVNIFGAQE